MFKKIITGSKQGLRRFRIIIPFVPLYLVSAIPFLEGIAWGIGEKFRLLVKVFMTFIGEYLLNEPGGPKCYDQEKI